MIENHIYHYQQDPEVAKRNKDLILDLIEQEKKIHNIQLNKQGYWYDFPSTDQRKRLYKEAAYSVIIPFAEQLAADFNCKLFRYPKLWFQQYPIGSEFGWHTHPRAHFGCIYFVELPEENYATEFLHFGRLEASEGDVVFFPAFLPHRSPFIDTDKRKTIISTNFDFNYER
jgi:hypothetical protein